MEFHFASFKVFTERDAAGQGGALRLPPRGTVALHHAVVQQVSRAGVGEGGALELHSVHLVDETRVDRKEQEKRSKLDFFFLFFYFFKRTH